MARLDTGLGPSCTLKRTKVAALRRQHGQAGRGQDRLHPTSMLHHFGPVSAPAAGGHAEHVAAAAPDRVREDQQPAPLRAPSAAGLQRKGGQPTPRRSSGQRVTRMTPTMFYRSIARAGALQVGETVPADRSGARFVGGWRVVSCLMFAVAGLALQPAGGFPAPRWGFGSARRSSAVEVCVTSTTNQRKDQL
jgi:hypothetical protein